MSSQLLAPSAPEIVRGYHGTSRATAECVLHESFRHSANEYDWLGDGVYFWQAAPERAWEWARKVHDKPAVVGASIELRDCLDLLDIKWGSILADAYDQFLAKLKASRMEIPRQTVGGHRLDRHVINYAVQILALGGVHIASVRAAFGEGQPLFANSALLGRSHVQIAVRDQSVILQKWLEAP